MSRAERRKNSVAKARRKKWISEHIYGWSWYDNLHKYSKGKIHCSCSMCAAKTNNKRHTIGCGYVGKDYRRIEEMQYEMEENAV